MASPLLLVDWGESLEMTVYRLLFWLSLYTVGVSASSASSPATPGCVVRSACWKEGIPSRGTWTDLRGVPVQTSWSSRRPSARFCTWVRAIPSTNRGWMENGLRAALPRRTWGYWWMKSSTWLSNVCSQPRRPTISWAASKAVWPAGRGRGFCLSALVRPHLHPALEPSA